jgi:hypothetical protein
VRIRNIEEDQTAALGLLLLPKVINRDMVRVTSRKKDLISYASMSLAKITHYKVEPTHLHPSQLHQMRFCNSGSQANTLKRLKQEQDIKVFVTISLGFYKVREKNDYEEMQM